VSDTGAMQVADLPTPALTIDRHALEHNLAVMSQALPGAALRPHVKAHKCAALAAVQQAQGHHSFTCATPRELIGLAAAGVGRDLLLANETLDPVRLAAMAAFQDDVVVTIAVDSPATIEAARRAGIGSVVIDVNVGLRRCGCSPESAGFLADEARSAGCVVRGVMGYEGHLMMVTDPADQRARVNDSVDRLMIAHAAVGGDVITGGGTGTAMLHRDDGRLTEVQAGSYALMDSAYAQFGHAFRQACFVVGTVISSDRRHVVADVGLKALAMDHGNPTVDGVPPDAVWFVSDEHIVFAPAEPVEVGGRVRVIPAHIDPTMSMHEVAWLVDGDEVIDRWPIDLRHW
jgi:D-threonine aldolase